RARFDGRDKIVGSLPVASKKLVGLGLVGVIVASFSGQIFDRNEERVMLQWIPLWMRFAVAIAAGALPLVITLRSFMRGDVERRGKVIAGLIVRLPIICLVSLIGIISLFQLTTVQAVRAVLITV
ncbi:MAG: hypothetical protein ACKODR_08715, partial [Acidimicrobiaceae bacterium]